MALTLSSATRERCKDTKRTHAKNKDVLRDFGELVVPLRTIITPTVWGGSDLPRDPGPVRAIPGTVITLCRFGNNGTLFLDRKSLENTHFTAISHVWGQPRSLRETRVKGVPHPVKWTSYKENFVLEKLESLVGRSYFWMDILCIDQRDKTAKSDIIERIPEIFRCAKNTIVIREPGGFGGCCFDYLRPTAVREKFEHHVSKDHPTGIRESILTRIWPWQEIMLSNNLQFITCKHTSQGPPKGSGPPVVHTAFPLAEALLFQAKGWVQRQELTRDQRFSDPRMIEHNFVEALCFDGCVGRPVSSDEQQLSTSEKIRKSLDSFAELLRTERSSTRTATRPEDFILSVCPSFYWWKSPGNLVGREFGNLFKHMMAVLRDPHRLHSNANTESPKRTLRPKVVQKMLEYPDGVTTSAFEAANDVPIPEDFGDFCSLVLQHAPPWGLSRSQ